MPETTRRANGQSSVAWDERDGRWHAYVSMGKKPGTNRYDRRHLAVRPTAPTDKAKAAAKKELEAEIRRLTKQRDDGVRQDPGIKTVADWLQHYIDNIAKRTLRPRSWERYESVIRLHLVPALGHIPLERLEPEPIEELYDHMAGKGLKGGSILYAHSVLRRALNIAVQRRRIARNPCLLVDSPSIADAEKVPPLTLAEAQIVIGLAYGRRNAARWLLGLSLGLRQSEALGLTWKHVHLDKGYIEVFAGLHRWKGKGLNLADVKSEAGRRTLALDPSLVAAMGVQRRQQEAERQHAGSEWANDRDLVFVQANGRPVDRWRDWTEWRDLLAEAGIPHRGTHAGRHTAASLLARLGVTPAEAKEILGHSRVSLTIDVYTHVYAEQSREALAKVAGALFGLPPSEPLPLALEPPTHP